MFKVTKYESEQDRIKKAEELKSIFGNLTGKIKGAKSYEVAMNINTSSLAYDVVINSSFGTIDDLDAYKVHPDHQYAIEKASAISKTKVLVDYKVERNKKTGIRFIKKTRTK